MPTRATCWSSSRAVLALLVIVLAALAVFAFPSAGTGLTFLVRSTAAGMVYEWIHYLIHTDYRPRHRPYRSVWRHHRLHHSRTSTTGSPSPPPGPPTGCCGTYPIRETVPTSPTAKDLHAHH